MRVGNYTLVQVLGRGGTSEVYAATCASGEPVAVKLLRPQLALDREVRDEFLAEAARTRGIQHPNIVRVFDVGHDSESGSCYLVMERIDGETLSARLERVTKLDEPTLRRLGATIADAMQAAHDRGIVHRDLKPGNVMLRGDEPTIVDFGIAKSLGAATAAHTQRRVGTVAYMAPEQLADGLITPAVDIWALGVILYEAATGQPPFSSFSDGRLPQLVEAAPRASTLASISPALDELIARCLERDPGKRPMAMANVARTLRDMSGEERVTEDIGPMVPAHGPGTRGTSDLQGVSGRSGTNTVRTVFVPVRWPMIVGGVLAGLAVTVLVLLTSETPRAPAAPEAPAAAPAAPATAPAAPAVAAPAATPSIDAGVSAVEDATPDPIERKRTRSKPPPSKPPTPPTPTTTRKTSQGETLD